jgi:hypothetical protein
MSWTGSSVCFLGDGDARRPRRLRTELAQHIEEVWEAGVQMGGALDANGASRTERGDGEAHEDAMVSVGPQQHVTLRPLPALGRESVDQAVAAVGLGDLAPHAPQLVRHHIEPPALVVVDVRRVPNPHLRVHERRDGRQRGDDGRQIAGVDLNRLRRCPLEEVKAVRYGVVDRVHAEGT